MMMMMTFQEGGINIGNESLLLLGINLKYIVRANTDLNIIRIDNLNSLLLFSTIIKVFCVAISCARVSRNTSKISAKSKVHERYEDSSDEEEKVIK